MRKTLVFCLFFLASLCVQAQILKPVKWKFEVKPKGEGKAELVMTARIEPKWHLYSQNLPEGGPIPTSFRFDKADGVQLIGKVEERSTLHESFDKNFDMTLKYYEETAVFAQKVSFTKSATVKGSLEFMVCDDKQCLPPDEVAFSFDLKGSEKPGATQSGNTTTTGDSVNPANQEPAVAETSTTSEAAPEKAQTVSSPAPASEPKKEEGLIKFLLIAFLGGLAAVVTPCVFPMLPMTVTFFTKQSGSKAAALRKALLFGGSIIAIYTSLGGLFALLGLGPDFANWLSTHWVPNIAFFIIFLVFGAAFLGMFEITLPHGLVNKIDQKSNMKSFGGLFFMAFTLVLVSFSCTGPIVGSLLIEAVGGKMIKPVLGMFSFSFGIALPFMLFAAFPSYLTNLPKSGGWLNSVKVFLGMLEIALAFKFLSIADQVYHWHILDREVYLAIWIVVFSLLGFYLLGKLKLPHDSDMPFISVPRLGLAIAVFTFVVYLIPGLFGAPLKALSGYLPPQSTLDFDLYSRQGGASEGHTSTLTEEVKFANLFHLPHNLEGFFDYKQALAYSKKVGKPVFIDFTGHGCVNCREMEANVWSQPEVLKRLREDFVVVALYVDDKTELPESDWYTSTYDNTVKKQIGKQNADLQISKFNANAQPYYVVVDGDGNQLGKSHAYDRDVNAFIQFLDAGKAAYQAKK